MNWRSFIFLLSCIILHCFGLSLRNSYGDNDYSDAYLDSYQLIEKYQYSPEKHNIITEDGYMITMFRLRRNGPPVLMAHGITDSSDSWLVLGPKESLAYLLYDAGFDVWLFNARGNKYSKGHAKNLTGKAYWDFSYEEVGSKDLVACIDYILYTTPFKSVSYVGFSQGTTIFFVLCSLRPEYNKKIQQAVLLAPVAWVHDIKYPLAQLIAQNLDVLSSFFDSIGWHELYSSNPLKNEYHAAACRAGFVTKQLCDLEFILMGLRNASSISDKKFAIVASHTPAGTSTKSFVHYFQNYRSRRFSRFDYGPKKNKKIYGDKVPPKYDLSKITTPVSLFASEIDWFSAIENSQMLNKRLPNVVNFILFNSSLEFTHIEFTYGNRVKTMVNDVVVSILQSSKLIEQL